MAKKAIELHDIGQRYCNHGTCFNAVIVPGESIRIFGIYGNNINGPVSFDKTFKIGDSAEYYSYNFAFFGTITKIGKKTVTIQHYPNQPTSSRLDLERFIWRNHGDEERKHEQRRAWSD